MCPPPCGPRRNRKCSSNSSEPAIKTKITKSEVEEVIYSGGFECLFKMSYDHDFQPYEGCTNNLVMILHDGETKVKVAGRRSPYFKDGFRTIVMDAPCFPAFILMRTEL